MSHLLCDIKWRRAENILKGLSFTVTVVSRRLERICLMVHCINNLHWYGVPLQKNKSVKSE